MSRAGAEPGWIRERYGAPGSQAAREAGAIRMDLGTGETDTAARALYESCGFTNREGGPDNPIMLYYERDL